MGAHLVPGWGDGTQVDFQCTCSRMGTGQEGSRAQVPSPGEAGAPFLAGRRGTPSPPQARVKHLPAINFPVTGHLPVRRMADPTSTDGPPVLPPHTH